MVSDAAGLSLLLLRSGTAANSAAHRDSGARLRGTSSRVTSPSRGPGSRTVAAAGQCGGVPWPGCTVTQCHVGFSHGRDTDSVTQAVRCGGVTSH
eukprot:447132-Hanusia_phi.AAC.1